jgi:hypothetical protein
MLSRGMTKANYMLKSSKILTANKSNMVKMNHKGFMTMNQNQNKYVSIIYNNCYGF